MNTLMGYISGKALQDLAWGNLVIAFWEHFILLWLSLWSVWIGELYLWGLCRLTMSKAVITTGRFGILCTRGHQASFHKEMKGSELWHTLFLTNPYCLAAVWLLFHMHLQGEFYKDYPSSFPGLGWLTRVPLFLNSLCLSHYSLGLFSVNSQGAALVVPSDMADCWSILG